MKKFTFIWLVALFMTWMVKPAFGVEYGTDFLEPGNPGGWSQSLKTFDKEWTVNPGDTFDVDIWINNVPEEIITSGFFIDYDASKVTIVRSDLYDGSLPGPWDGDMTTIVENPSGPGTYMVVVGNLSSVLLDASSDIPIAKITFECTSPGNTTVTFRPVPGFDTIVGNSSTVYDSEIAPTTIIISQEQSTSSTTSTSIPTTTSTSSPVTTTTSIIEKCELDSDCPDDGLYCNGDEFCDVEKAICASTFNPCAADHICDEDADACRAVGLQPSPLTLQLTPESWYQSWWVPLIKFLRIEGSDTHFEKSVTEITCTPDSAVIMLPMVIDETTINCIGILLPRWWAPVDSIDVAVTTGAEEATETIEIKLLPFILEQRENPFWEE